MNRTITIREESLVVARRHAGWALRDLVEQIGSADGGTFDVDLETMSALVAAAKLAKAVGADPFPLVEEAVIGGDRWETLAEILVSDIRAVEDDESISALADEMERYGTTGARGLLAEIGGRS